MPILQPHSYILELNLGILLLIVQVPQPHLSPLLNLKLLLLHKPRLRPKPRFRP